MLKPHHILPVFLFITPAQAEEGDLHGCCSHHDGIKHCSADGLLVCRKDDWVSSCPCDIEKSTDEITTEEEPKGESNPKMGYGGITPPPPP